jgi:hypothetical protein
MPRSGEGRILGAPNGGFVVESQVREPSELSPEPTELGDVLGREALQAATTMTAQTDPHDALVLRIGTARHEPGRLGPVDQTHGAVVAE